MYHVTMV